MNKKHLVAASIAALTLMVSGCAATGGSTDTTATAGPPITIGMVTPLTGLFAPLGNGALAAVQSEIARLNAAGGIDGHQVNLVYKDDTSTPDQSVIAYNELASDDSVVAILSSSSVTNSAATGPAAERAEIPTIALSPVNAFADGSNKWVFTVPAGAGLSAAELASYAKASGFKTVAIAHSQDAYGDAGLATTTGALKKVGVDVVMEESYDATATDFTALLTHVKQAAPDALIVWGAGAGPVIITKQFAGMGINAQLIMTGAQASSLYVDPAGDAAEGVVMSSSISVPGEELPASPLKDAIDKFVTPFEAANGGAYPAQFGFDGAAGVQLIQAAIEKAGSVDRSAIRDSLDTLKVLTSNGTYSYSADNHMGLTPAAVTMVVVKGGKLVATDYAKSTFADKTK